MLQCLSMRSDIKYIGIGLLIGGVTAVIINMGAFLAGILPLAPTPQAVTQPARAPFTLTPAFTPTSDPAPYLDLSVSPTPDLEILLADQIIQTLPDYGGDWNILIREDGNKVLFSLNAEQKIHVASIIKVPIAMLFFKSVEEKGIPPSTYAEYLSTRGIGRTYQQLLKAMLVDSEEDATRTLRDIIRESQIDVDAALQAWGAFDTDISSRYSTPQDVAALFESLYFGTAITPEGRQIILDLLSTYTPNDDTRLGVLRASLPAGSKFYNKRGTVTEGRLIVGDAALMAWDEGGREKVHVIVALSYVGELPTTDVKLVKGIESIARLFWNFAAPPSP